MVSCFCELFRILMSMWIFLVFSSFRELLCAIQCGTLHSDSDPWRTVHNFSTFSNKMYLWRERERYEWYCDRTSSVQVWIEYDSVISHYLHVAACAVIHLYHGDWEYIFLPNTYTHLPHYVISLSRRPLYYIHQDVTTNISVRVKNISTYSSCQGCC